jgi:hypothetical protein
MNAILKSLALLLLLAITNHPTVHAQTCNSNYYPGVTSTGALNNTFSYTCRGQGYPPGMPTMYAYATTTLSLSPNLYTSVPYTDVCQFQNTHTLNMSNNYLTSLTGSFARMTCMSSLKYVDFSNNQIASPLVYSDFNDASSQKIVSMNFNYNRIPYIDTTTFFTANGQTSRFPNLQYIGLSNNQLTNFDMLWPLSLPSPKLNVDLSYNQQMSSFVNQLNVPYTDPRFQYPVTGGRTVNVAMNGVRSFGDNDLSQYGVNNYRSFCGFVQQVPNYYFTNNNGFYCSCTGAQMINSWYSQYNSQYYSQGSSQTFYTNAPFFNMRCQQYGSNVIVFDFSSYCQPYTVRKMFFYLIFFLMFLEFN